MTVKCAGRNHSVGERQCAEKARSIFAIRTCNAPVELIDGRQFRRSISRRMLFKRILKPGLETSAALIGTAFSAMLLVLTAMNAGPLSRDETNTFNLAHMPSLQDIGTTCSLNHFRCSGRCWCADAACWG